MVSFHDYAGTIYLNGDLNAIGGLFVGTATQGLGGYIDMENAVVLTANRRVTPPRTDVPHRIHALDDIDAAGALRTALRAGPDTVHVVRPDGHFAAVLPSSDPGPRADALHRACGR